MDISNLRWGLYDDNLAFSTSLGSNYEIKVIGTVVPEARTMSDLDSAVFEADDDGLDLQRESLLRFRVATAVAETMGDRGLMLAERFERRAERVEREIEGCMDQLVTADRQATGRGVRVLDL